MDGIEISGSVEVDAPQVTGTVEVDAPQVTGEIPGTFLVGIPGPAGPKGDPGEPGVKGDKGDVGKNAYQYALDGGYTGTEEEFAAKLASEPSVDVDFKTNETLTLKDGVLSVNTTDSMEQDNTLPITSAGVFAAVGNIEALLKTI